MRRAADRYPAGFDPAAHVVAGWVAGNTAHGVRQGGSAHGTIACGRAVSAGYPFQGSADHLAGHNVRDRMDPAVVCPDCAPAIDRCVVSPVIRVGAVKRGQ